MHDDIMAAGAQVVGVSPQTAATHERFAEQYGLSFPLLADPRKTLIRACGVDGPLGFGVRRATFLIGTDGIVQQRHVSDFMVNTHIDFVRRSLDSE